MNDIKKLHQVIDSLEEQSSKVTEFNGVLSAVNSAREQIDNATILLTKLVDEQKDLASENFKRFDDYSKGLKSHVASLVDTQNTILREISAIEFVTPQRHKEDLAVTEEAIARHIAALTQKIDAATVEQHSAFKSLRRIVTFGVLVLISALAFFMVNSVI